MTALAPTPLRRVSRGCLSCGAELSVHRQACDECGSVVVTDPIPADVLVDVLRRHNFHEVPA